jgi:hypothetical protein
LNNPDLTPGLLKQLVPLFADHDIAVLYIRDDRVLPPRVEEDGAKRINLIAPLPTWNMRQFGWGLPAGTLTVPPGSDMLRVGNTNLPTYSRVGCTIRGNSTPMQSGICAGDSGGPLVRMDVNVPTNQYPGNPTGNPIPVQVITGVASWSSLSDAECSGQATPAAGEQSAWARVDEQCNFGFIESLIRQWNGNPGADTAARRNPNGFRCVRRTIQGEATPTVAECWGRPCQAPNHCSSIPNSACMGSPEEFSSCPACDQLGGGCGCIVGQCVANPYRPTPP